MDLRHGFVAALRSQTTGARILRFLGLWTLLILFSYLVAVRVVTPMLVNSAGLNPVSDSRSSSRWDAVTRSAKTGSKSAEPDLQLSPLKPSPARR